MLPLPVQFLIASVAYAINERMAKQLDYLLEEIRVLHEAYTEATGCKRVPFTIAFGDSCASRRTVYLHGKLQQAGPFRSGSPTLSVAA